MYLDIPYVVHTGVVDAEHPVPDGDAALPREGEQLTYRNIHAGRAEIWSK